MCCGLDVWHAATLSHSVNDIKQMQREYLYAYYNTIPIGNVHSVVSQISAHGHLPGGFLWQQTSDIRTELIALLFVGAHRINTCTCT